MHMRLKHDPKQVFTTGSIPPLSIEDYGWRYPLQDNGIPLKWTDWLKANCENAWGWWFDVDSMCHVGFIDKAEMMRFVMSYSDG